MFPIRDHNPSGRTPYVTYALIALNVLIFLGYFWRPEAEIQTFFYDWAVIPANVAAGQDYYSVVSAMFLHGGVMHIAGNMLFLYIFGDNIEDYWGPIPFLAFYIFCGFCATALQIYADPHSTVPNIGASGAIAGVMGAYLLLYPRAQVDVVIILGFFARLIVLPAFIVLLMWFALQILGGFATVGNDGGGIAYWAHAGGFLGGAALVGLAWLAGRKPHVIEGRPGNPEIAYPPAVRRSRFM